MREMTQNFLRGFCLAALMATGSCTSPFNDANPTFDDPRGQSSHHGRAQPIGR